MPTTLAQILGSARWRVAETKSRVTIGSLEKLAQNHTPRGFERALRATAKTRPAVIAELKRASPSKGMIRGSFHPAALADELVKGGATALSVLTEEQYFQGSLDYLVEVSAAVEIPLLRKDFIVDEFQVLEARANCADAILLIVAALSDVELESLRERANQYELDVLCEVHDENELERAAHLGFSVIGVNNRNLHTFEVDLKTSEGLAQKMPSNVLRVAESGIASAADIGKLRGIGYDAFLIGETLMRKDHPGQGLAELLGPATVTR